MARVLITRPEPDATDLAEMLRERGHEPVIAPLLEIRHRASTFDPRPPAKKPTPDEVPGPIQGLLFTSANGVRAAAQTFRNRTTPALCVGPSTAAAARDAGFEEVRVAGGDVDALTDLVTLSCTPGDGTLVHLSGSTVAGDLAGRLERRGFTVASVVLYDAVVPDRLPEPAKEGLSAGTIDAVMLFSPRTAATFATLARDADLSSTCANIDMLCISENVAEALGDLPGKRRLVAHDTTQEALIDLL